MSLPTNAVARSADETGESRPLGYRAVAGLSRFLLNLFYPRIEIVGAENIPLDRPLIVAANHHNSLVDAMMLVSVFPRQLRTLANAPLFRNPLVGPFLRVMGGLPVHRRQEAGNDPAKNAALFTATTAALRAGGAIMLFPEGRTQPEPVLLELRTGAARMLLAAHAEGLMRAPATLLPVGLVFHDPGTFREGDALVLIGTPIETADCLAVAAADAPRAAHILTDRLAEAIRGLIVEAGDRESLDLLHFARELRTHAISAASPADGRERVTWLQDAMRIYREVSNREPARAAAFRERLAGYARELEDAGLTPTVLAAERASAPSSPLGDAAFLLFLAPLAIAGIVVHIIPYKLTGSVVARILKDEEEEATDKIAAGFVFFLAAWAIETAIAFYLAGIWAALGFLAALLPLGFIALAWTERLARILRSVRDQRRITADPERILELRERCRALANELSDFAEAAKKPENRQ